MCVFEYVWKYVCIMQIRAHRTLNVCAYMPQRHARGGGVSAAPSEGNFPRTLRQLSPKFTRYLGLNPKNRLPSPQNRGYVVLSQKITRYLVLKG